MTLHGSSSSNLSWIRLPMCCFCSADDGETVSRVCAGKRMASSCCTDGWSKAYQWSRFRIRGKDVNLAAVPLAHGWTTNRAAESPPPGDRIGRSLSKEDYPEAIENAGFSLCFVV